MPRQEGESVDDTGEKVRSEDDAAGLRYVSGSSIARNAKQCCQLNQSRPNDLCKRGGFRPSLVSDLSLHLDIQCRQVRLIQIAWSIGCPRLQSLLYSTRTVLWFRTDFSLRMNASKTLHTNRVPKRSKAITFGRARATLGYSYASLGKSNGRYRSESESVDSTSSAKNRSSPAHIASAFAC